MKANNTPKNEEINAKNIFLYVILPCIGIILMCMFGK